MKTVDQLSIDLTREAQQLAFKAQEECRQLRADLEAAEQQTMRAMGIITRVTAERDELSEVCDSLIKALSEVLEFQSAESGPTIHDWGRWRRVRDAAMASQTTETAPRDGA